MMHQAAGADNGNEDYEGDDEGAEGLDEKGLHYVMILELGAKRTGPGLRVAQIEFDLLGGPRGETRAEEILIFGPDGKSQQLGHRGDGPIFGLARRNAFASQ